MILLKATNGNWEEVTEAVFNERKNVVGDDDTPRYTGDAIIKANGSITINASFSPEDLGKAARFLGVSIPMGSYAPIIVKPESVKIKRQRSIRLHMLESGQEFMPVRK